MVRARNWQMRLVTCALLIALAVAVACGSGPVVDRTPSVTSPTPSPSSEFVLCPRDHPGSRAPELEVTFGGRRLQLMQGPTDWCLLHGDAFEVHTPPEPLVVAPRARVRIPNPLAEPILRHGVKIHEVRAEPTVLSGRLVWPGLRWSGPGFGPMPAVDEIGFNAPDRVGTYVVDVYVEYERLNGNGRNSHYAFLLHVVE